HQVSEILFSHFWGQVISSTRAIHKTPPGLLQALHQRLSKQGLKIERRGSPPVPGCPRLETIEQQDNLCCATWYQRFSHHAQKVYAGGWLLIDSVGTC